MHGRHFFDSAMQPNGRIGVFEGGHAQQHPPVHVMRWCQEPGHVFARFGQVMSSALDALSLAAQSQGAQTEGAS
jgi:hypothetical protein